MLRKGPNYPDCFVYLFCSWIIYNCAQNFFLVTLLGPYMVQGLTELEYARQVYCPLYYISRPDV